MASEEVYFGYEIHPAANLFPMLDEKRLKELADDIKANGQKIAIQILDGQIIDGRNRAKACEIAGVAPQFETIQCENPYWYVWSLNGNRRDLPDLTRAIAFMGCQDAATTYEQAKAEAEAKRREAIEEKRKDQPAPNPSGINQHSDERLDGRNSSAHPTERTRDDTNRTAHALAKQAGVGRAIMEKAISIAKFDQKHGTRYVEQVRAGAIRPTKALTEVRKANLAEKTKAQVADVAATLPVIYCAQAQDFLAGIEDGSVDLLLTDPPYETDVEDMPGFIASWLPTALRKIKPTGRAYICIGAYPSELAAYLNAISAQSHMTLANVLVWTYRNTLGPSPKTQYKLNWQAVLYLIGPESGPLDCPVMTEQFSVMDINAPDGRQGDRYHPWQKPLEIGDRFVRHATKHGDIVIDPFACTGTFLLAAAQLGRIAKGCDIDPRAIAIAQSRGCLAQAEVI